MIEHVILYVAGFASGAFMTAAVFAVMINRTIREAAEHAEKLAQG